VILYSKMVEDRADTVPGFTMQSENFFLKFITGLQCGVSSKLLEYETDWYEVMEIILSRLEDEPETKDKFEVIAARDLEYWAKMQPGGDSLNLRISVLLEEKRYFEPPLGSRKALRLLFNDRFSTQVIFHVRKKSLLKSLLTISELAVAELILKEETLVQLESEIPQNLIPGVSRAFHNCWTPRFYRTKVARCPASCVCKNRTTKSYVEQLISNTGIRDPMPVSPSLQEPDPAQPQADPPAPPVVEEEPQPSTSQSQRQARKGPKKMVNRKSKRMKAKNLRRKIRSENRSKECQTCSGKEKVSTRSSCDKRQKETKTEEVRRSPRSRNKYFNGLKVRIKLLHIEIESLVMKVKGKKPRAEEKTETKLRTSSRLSSLKQSLMGRSRKRAGTSEEIFEPRPEASSSSSESSRKSLRRLSTRVSNRENAFKRTLRSQMLDSSSARKKRRHS